jgi:hypothetical protein
MGPLLMEDFVPPFHSDLDNTATQGGRGFCCHHLSLGNILPPFNSSSLNFLGWSQFGGGLLHQHLPSESLNVFFCITMLFQLPGSLAAIMTRMLGIKV